jgi:hypothetical protein
VPSDIKLVFTFVKASDKVLLSHKPLGDIDGDYVPPDFILRLKYFELYLRRKVLNPVISERIEHELSQKSSGVPKQLTYFYNR